MELVVSRFPLPQPLVELGELYESRGAEGDKAKAEDQYALVDAWIALARANGVNADLDTALAAADHGDVKSALKAARAEWARRHTVHTADALAWALHVNGLDKEALPYARQATATNYHNASFIYHLGTIELATGHKADGRAHLAKALKLNPGFSPLGAAKAVRRWRLQVTPFRRLLASAAAVLTTAGALLLVPTAAASAHPLGNFTVNRYDGLVVAPGQLRVTHIEDLAEIPATQVKPDIRRLGMTEWARERCDKAAEGSKVTVDGRTVALTPGTSTAHLRPGQAGLNTLRVECGSSAALPKGAPSPSASTARG